MSEPRPAAEAVDDFLRRRREAIGRHPSQIGIDYVVVDRDDSVTPPRRRLDIHFVPDTSGGGTDKHAVLDDLEVANIRTLEDEVPADGLFELTHEHPGIGTIESTGTDVTGTGTAFVGDVAVGDEIIAAGDRRRVTSINTNGSLEVDTPFTNDLPPGTKYDIGVDVDLERTDDVLSVWFRFAGDSDPSRRRAGAPIFTVELIDVDELDPFFSRADFSLDLEPPLEEECLETCPPPAEDPLEPIDYLARDYQSFRQVLIERLGQRLPQWTERSAADQMVVFTEVLADAADQLAYFQDAVATEAYLGTARRRISVRRHGWLVGHRIAEGTNARSWVQLQTAGFGVGIQPGTGTIESAGTTVLGTGTAFAAEVRVGDTIRAAGETRRIIAISSATELELDEPFLAAGLPLGTGFDIARTLTGTVESVGSLVTGTGTAFTTELSVGDRVDAAGQVRTVTTLTSDTELGLDTPFTPDAPAGTTLSRLRTGMGTVSSAGTTITGGTTFFTTEVAAGDRIVALGLTRTVSSVVSDTELVVDDDFSRDLSAGTTLSTPATQTGSGTVESTGVTLTGRGTSFTTELFVGDLVRANGQTRRVVAIVSDTELELDAAFVPNLAVTTGFDVPALQAGGGTVESAITTLTGTGTTFTDELVAGDDITAAGQRRAVVSVVSDTELELDRAFDPELAAGSSFAIAATQAASGTVSTDGTTLTGSGTAFTTELQVGSIVITAAGQRRTVARVFSDTSAELDAPFGLPPGTGFLRPGAQLLPRVPGQTAAVLPSTSTALRQFLTTDPVVFETMHPVELYQAHNEIPIYTWGSPEYALPTGTTRTALAGSFPNLRVGDVMIFEEVRGRDTGLAEDVDPMRRHVVRLTRVSAAEDPLGDDLQDPPVPDPLTEIEWDASDALPFTLSISKVLEDGSVIADIAVARGNIVLADHGRGVAQVDEPLVATDGRFRPRLAYPDLTHRVPYDHRAAVGRPADVAFAQSTEEALPVIDLRDDERVWHLRRDLLNSDRFAADFVVEMQNDGQAVLRFGDGTLGRAPRPDTELVPRYRIGRGVVGNLGAESLVHLVSDMAPPVTEVCNPLPAAGGRRPETLADVRRAAPGRLIALEANTNAQELADLLAEHPEVRRAAAQLRWTGSWHRLVVAVERQGGGEVDAAFQAELRTFLEDYRLGGWELTVEPLAYIGLDILFTVLVTPVAVAAAVERQLLEVFSNRILDDGSRGFFHPDNFTFGEPVYLSRVIDTAMAVDGVLAVDTDDTPPRLSRFRRFGEPSRGELAAGQIRLSGAEVARVDNDPDAPENGRIGFFMEGGR